MIFFNKTNEAIKELRELESRSYDFEFLKKENTRLKKQLAKDHHVECSCSFCKPVDNQLKEDLEDYNKMVKVGINAN